MSDTIDQQKYPGAARYPYPELERLSPSDPAYFIRREPPADVDYEASYWGVITDPDGNVRDRRLERDQAVADLSEELEEIEATLGYWRRDATSKPAVLDVGCGLGFLLSGLSDGWEKHGLDLSHFATDFASREYGIETFTGTLRRALEVGRYRPQSFDVVVLHHVIEHVDRPLDLMADIAAVIRPGGMLVLGTPDFDGAMARRFGPRYRMLHDPTHVSLFTLESTYRMLRDLGWAVDRVGFPYFETRHFTSENLLRVMDTSKLSPAWPGSFMTFYCTRL